MKAKDLMIPLEEYLTPDTTLREAVSLLQTAARGEGRIGVKGLPVLDTSGRPVGMVSMHDALKAVCPPYLSLMHLGHFTWDGMVEDLARKAGARKVSELMSRNVVTIRDSEPLMGCIDLMLAKRIKRLPVVDAAGKVVGMLYERDIFFAIAKAMLEPQSSTGGEK